MWICLLSSRILFMFDVIWTVKNGLGGVCFCLRSKLSISMSSWRIRQLEIRPDFDRIAIVCDIFTLLCV